jgi:hypothetical protein
MIPFGTIAEVAAEWYDRNCVEDSENRGVCVDKIHELFDPQWIASKRAEAWCAKFVWVVYEEAARRSGNKNPLPRTAGAKDMLNKSRDLGLDVDNKPRYGDVFYRTSESRGRSGHVGIVTDIQKDGITTVEGNLNNRVAYYFYDWNQIALPKWKFNFIHAADPSKRGGSAILAGSNGLLGLVLVGTAALWYFNKKK